MHEQHPKDCGCGRCTLAAALRLKHGQDMAGVPVRSSDQLHVRAVGGFVQVKERVGRAF